MLFGFHEFLSLNCVDGFLVFFAAGFFFRIPDMAKACSPAKLDRGFSWKNTVFQPSRVLLAIHTWDRLGLNINMFKRSQHFGKHNMEKKQVSFQSTVNH